MSEKDPRKEMKKKMRAVGLPKLAIKNFLHYYEQLAEGHTGLIGESEVEPVGDLPDLDKLDDFGDQGRQALQNAVMIKLNGGLGTSMGLSKAKSLLPAKDGLSFLDIIAKQISVLREKVGCGVPLVLMNSFNTEEDTLAALEKYPELEEGQNVPFSFLQNKVPKIRQSDLKPVSWPRNPDLEWCPPGHGDIYTALVTSGMLDRLLEQGAEYAFVSNSDNLGATLDLQILGYFADSGAPFLMEVADRTEADKKGGHLAYTADGGLILRESAQCPHEEMDQFQDTDKYRYFNTNNLWVNLKALKAKLDSTDGVLDLPLIRNSKTVDPKDKESTPVYQLETAMGAAIAVFDGAAALRVPRTRFAPVKTTADLLAIWSDCFVLTDNYNVAASPERSLGTIVIDLDKRCYKLIDDFKRHFPHGAPSLVECEKLAVEGDVYFGDNVKIVGSKTIAADGTKTIPDGSVLKG